MNGILTFFSQKIYTLMGLNQKLPVMGTVKRLNKWANAHTYYPLDLLRVVLGIFLFVKGVEFMANYPDMAEMARPFEGLPGGMIMLHYIAPAHFVGGILIVVGRSEERRVGKEWRSWWWP